MRASGIWRTVVGSGPVSRRQYVVVAGVLAVIKYLGDAFALARTLPAPWGPADYLRGLILPPEAWARLSAPQLAFLLLWGAAFLWFAVDLSRRRAVDAGHSAWWGLGVIVPWLNYLVFVVLVMMPSRPPAVVHSAPDRLQPPARAMVLSVVLLLALTAIVAYAILVERYPASLFVSAPFLLGVAAGWWANADSTRSRTVTVAWACVPLVPLSLVLLLGGIEGLLCIAMALPLAMPLLALGALAGRRMVGDASAARGAVVSLVMMPLVGLMEPSAASLEREVVSSVEIAAPVDAVWSSVIAFPPIATPPEGLFRLGIAMPVSATLDGEGVGAVRRCRFTTGDFVEPITVWEPERRLAFDVAEQPLPLRELSWRSIAPPHLDVGFRSVRGEFRLTPLADGRTRLEGRTWYVLDLQPVAYWALWSDAIVHRVHERVLRHIATVSEAGTDGHVGGRPSPE